MTRQIGILMDALESINPKKDSTLAMMVAAQAAGWQLHCFEQSDMWIEDGKVSIRQRPVKVMHDPAHWYEADAATTIHATQLDAILLRKEPPFDMEYIYSTYLLEFVERAGTPVLNRPGSVRDCNEKVFALEFPEVCPPHLVSRDPQQLHAFHQQHQDVIYKPLDGMGGVSIFRATAAEHNLSVIIETLTANGTAAGHGAAIHPGNSAERRYADSAYQWCAGALWSCPNTAPGGNARQSGGGCLGSRPGVDRPGSIDLRATGTLSQRKGALFCWH